MNRSVPLDPETLLSAYAQGVFPMADRDGHIRWYTADPRGVLPLDEPDKSNPAKPAFHVPGTLRSVVRQGKFEIKINYDFEATMTGCMESRTEGTWISQRLIPAYERLHELGFAHSVEAWRDGELAGGLYGVSIGGAFFGESMFHRQTDASKVALVFLVNRLRERNFELLDTQATTDHLRKFGAIDIPAVEYQRRLKIAMNKKCQFG